MTFQWRFYWSSARCIWQKWIIYPNTMARGPCSCIGCIGLRPTLTTLTCFNVHVKPHYCRAAATVNCAVTNVTYNEKKYYVVTWTCFESSMYLHWRQWLRQIVMCHIACWFSSGAVLKFDQFYRSHFKPTSALFPRKCTYETVIDLRIMVLWSIRFISNDIASPPTN